MDELDKLTSWMRANGVAELTYQGTTIRFADGGPPPTQPESPIEESARTSRPLVKGECRVCGEPAKGLYAKQNLCRLHGWEDVSGAAV